MTFGLDSYAVDPFHAMLVKRKQSLESPSISVHNENDVRELSEFCSKYGIVGVNFGNIPPRTTLNMLKRKMGVLERDSCSSKKMLLKG